MDLEDTVIDRFDRNPIKLVNIPYVVKYLTDNNISDVEIFSFAIWGEKEKDDFKNNMKSILEKELNVTISNEVLTLDRLIRIFSSNKKTNQIAFNDFFQFVDKTTMFIEYVKYLSYRDLKLKDTQYILIDDLVMDTLVHFKNRNLQIELVNVKNLKEN